MQTIRDITGYATSKDYCALAALARQQSIVCEVDYRVDQQDVTTRDVARTLYRECNGEELFEIGARGTGYVHAAGEEEFIRQCERMNVSFLVPTTEPNDQAERFERGWYLRGEALDKIKQWAEAYPLAVFPEMSPDDWKRAAETLAGAGLTLDRISASNMRHVITQTVKIVDDGLAA